MDIQLIRNATLVLHYGDKKIIVDPFFADKGSMPPFQNTPNQDQNNPTVGLPFAIDSLLDADAVIVTHLHPDHFDEMAKKRLPKDILLYAQNEQDCQVIQEAGFTNVHSLENSPQVGDVTIKRTNGKHGTGDILKKTGIVSGVVFTHPDEKTLYVAGDTIWCPDVEEAIQTHHPDVIVLNGGAAQYLVGDPITMTKEDIYEVYKAAPNAQIVVCHMESLNHCLLKRTELSEFLSMNKAADRIAMPNDGEKLSYN